VAVRYAERQVHSLPQIPYTADTRPDTGVTNPQLGIWLFLASETMLFGSLFSAYALLRSGAESWPDQQALMNVPLGAINTGVLLLSSFAVARASAASGVRRAYLGATVLLGAIFLAIKGVEYAEKLAAGAGPASHNFLGLYYTITALHAVHLAGGIAVIAYLWGPGARLREVEPRRFAQRVKLAGLYWHFVDAVWLTIFAVFYLL
jgi:cytochrome c oxidase subunit III